MEVTAKIVAMLSSETGLLALFGLWCLVTIMAQVLAAIPQLGFVYLLGPRDEGRRTYGMAARLARTVENSVTAMALFAPAILMVSYLDVAGESSLLAAQVFFAARLAFVPLYAFGVPWLRTPVWGLVALATAWLYVLVLIELTSYPA